MKTEIEIASPPSGRVAGPSDTAAGTRSVDGRWKRTAFWLGFGVVAFHAAYAINSAGGLIVLFLFGLMQLAKADSWRWAFYPGLLAGLAIAAGRLGFFFRIFGGGALALWVVFAIWIALFVTLASLSLKRLPPPWNWLLIPFLWCGLEYFRSELYYLRFSWLSPGFAFAFAPSQAPLSPVGAYGIGFLLAAVAAVAVRCWPKSKPGAAGVLVAGVALLWLAGGLDLGSAPSPKDTVVKVTGVQMEFPSENEVLIRLREALRKHPDTDLMVLSEYTFEQPVPDKVRAWCRENRRYLLAGGKEPAPGGKFFNTACVVAPNGEIVFRQAKTVPIQFFNDGLPAPEQKLWPSPWGRIGICICYDLSYSRVTDRLVNLGAEALLVPTMDQVDWGLRQHQLHARVAPTRAAEYGIPIFRLASSGISQCVDRSGHVLATAPFPGDGAIISGTLVLNGPGTLPWDRRLAQFSVGLTGLFVLACLWRRFKPVGVSLC